MRFKNLGITHNKAQNAAITCVLALTDQYLKLTKESPEAIAQRRAQFDRLVKDINDYHAGRDYVEVPIEEIAALKNCKKDQILIIY
jgi:hypothetical protein